MNWENPEFHNFRVSVYGETAVVTSVFDFKVSGGKVPIPIISDAQIVDVWTKRGGQWQIAARHLGAYSIGGYFRLFRRIRRRFGLLFRHLAAIENQKKICGKKESSGNEKPLFNEAAYKSAIREAVKRKLTPAESADCSGLDEDIRRTRVSTLLTKIIEFNRKCH